MLDRRSWRPMAGSQFQPGRLERSGKALAEYPRTDIQVERIAYLVMLDRAAFTLILSFIHHSFNLRSFECVHQPVQCVLRSCAGSLELREAFSMGFMSGL